MEYICGTCGGRKEGRRLPPGWKAVGEARHCKDCFRRQYVVRAVTLPVAEPVGSSWEALWEALHKAWRLSTGLANWTVQDLFRLDTSGADKAPDAVRDYYGYGAAKERYPQFGDWAGAKGSLNIVVRGVASKYLQTRWAVMVRHEQSLLSYRYPYPFPVDADDWTPGYEPGDFPLVELNLPGAGPWKLRLRRRADFGRQLAAFRQLAGGQALKAEAAIHKNRKNDVLLKLVGWFPRQTKGEATNVALVYTDPGALLVVEVNGRRADVTNGDHIRREIARHKNMLGRTRQDKKREVRMDRRQRRNLNRHVAGRCGKNDDRLDTYTKQVARQVARMLERQGVGLVLYDDRRRDYLPEGFRWAALKERLRQLVAVEMGSEWVDSEFTHLKSQEREKWLELAKSTSAMGRKALAASQRSRSHPSVSTCPPPKSRRGSARP